MAKENKTLLSIPRIYYQTGEIEPFLQAVDKSFAEIEIAISNLTDLVDIDSCPDSVLPYLAALINCPLWGQNTLLWRKQIKNWPYVCRMKGTKRALRYFFDSIGVVVESIETYWRDNKGKYVVNKPDNKPYLDKSGLWNNSKTHYFGVILSADEDKIVNIADKNLCNTSKLILNWISMVKPYHSELLRIAWAVNEVIRMKIFNKFESEQYVDARHCFWNLGSVEFARRDGRFKRDGTTRRTGKNPNELYKEKQKHQLEVDLLVECKMTGNQLVDMRGNSFCRNGSHLRNGGYEQRNMISNCCTVTYIKNGIEVVEYV